MHTRFFQRLDLSLIRGDQLEHAEVKSAFSRMGRLRLVELPADGWSTFHEKNKVARLFPHSCVVRFNTKAGYTFGLHRDGVLPNSLNDSTPLKIVEQITSVEPHLISIETPLNLRLTSSNSSVLLNLGEHCISVQPRLSSVEAPRNLRSTSLNLC